MSVVYFVLAILALITLMVVSLVVTAAHWTVSRLERALRYVLELLDHLSTLLARWI